MKSVFCESIVALTYDQTYLLLLSWNNGTKNIIYDNYKLVFCHYELQNCNIDLLLNLFTIIYVKNGRRKIVNDN